MWERDSLTPAGLGELASALGVEDSGGLDGLSDEAAISTILQGEQSSYTSAAGCEYPDAYVDPCPEVFAQLQAYAQSGQQLHTALSALPDRNPDLLVWASGGFEAVVCCLLRVRGAAMSFWISLRL